MRATVKTQRSVATAAILAAVFAGVFLATRLTPLVADDFNYAFSWRSGERIRDLGEVIGSMSVHRDCTNGRVFAHGLLQTFSFLPGWIFVLCNALVGLGLAQMLRRYLERWSGRPRPGLLLLCVAMLWICMPVYGQVFLWRDGACNYGWGLLLALALLYPFFLALREEPELPLPLRIACLPLAFLAGAWSEHISFAALAAAGFVTLAVWIRRRRAPVWLLALLLCGGAGYLYLMLAPSMLGANAGDRGSLSLRALVQPLRALWEKLALLPAGQLLVPAALILALGLLVVWRIRRGRRSALCLLCAVGAGACALGVAVAALLALRAGKGVYGLVSSSAVGLLLALGWALGLFALALHRGAGKEVLLFPVLLFLGGLCSLVPFAFASYFPARGCAVLVLFSVLSGALAAAELEEDRGPRIAAAAVLLVFALDLALGGADILAVHRSERLRQSRIEAALQGDGHVSAPAHPVRSKYSAQYGLEDINERGDWPNDEMARYYGFIQILREDPPDAAG
ncbi:MAG: hypothetical protein IK095_04895 [Oscillospiraceae bacterium]|nr:hypothetical protein [Oscillospiraceae bacterium]